MPKAKKKISSKKRPIANVNCVIEKRPIDPAIMGIARLITGPNGRDPATIAWAAMLFNRLAKPGENPLPGVAPDGPAPGPDVSEILASRRARAAISGVIRLLSAPGALDRNNIAWAALLMSRIDLPAKVDMGATTPVPSSDPATIASAATLLNRSGDRQPSLRLIDGGAA
jgi:hypothetical protein